MGFDEFNLDLRLNYEGALLHLPERKRDTDAILAIDDGERLLAGYLLRGSADKAQSAHKAGRTLLHFHFDHLPHAGGAYRLAAERQSENFVQWFIMWLVHSDVYGRGGDSFNIRLTFKKMA